jgi:hypothetical protein
MPIQKPFEIPNTDLMSRKFHRQIEPRKEVSVSRNDDSMLHTVTLAKFNAYFLKQVLPPRNEDNVDS